MTQRQKLELPINQTVEIELIYDEPVTGKSQYGQYYMYAVEYDGSEYTYFAPEDVHLKLSSMHKGDRATITKLASQQGNKLVTVYDVKPINSGNNPLPDNDNSDTPIFSPEQDDDDGLYEIMLQSYRDAIRITRELNSLADPSRIAITLFISRTKA